MYVIKDLNFTYDTGQVIFQNASLDLDSQKLTGLTGKNGSGKTTFCRLLCGLITRYAGSIKLQDKNLKEMSTAEIARTVTYIKQEALANIVAATPSEDLTLWLHRFSSGNIGDAKTINPALEQFKIAECKDKPIWEMSSGQIRRINLAALLLNPDKYWIIDEPMAGLDADIQNIFIKMLLNKRNSGTGALVISHDQGYLMQHLDYVYQIEDQKFKVS
ncbi:MAG: ABC transporter ATP-binding protein [Candidatus Cloacimonetes bacterium]|nr:ABC transporter ATP-binding protein [Candidatus Cloacimonadota bacterium]